MNEIKSFTFYKNYYELLDNLPTKDKRKMLEIIVDYVFKNKEPNDLKNMNLAIWNNLKMPLDKSKKNSLRSLDNGAPTGNQNALKKQTKNKPKTNQMGNQKQTNNISIFLFLLSNLYISNIDNKDIIYKLFKEYLELRSKKKYTLTETIVTRLVNKLNEYGKTDEQKIEIITNAINGAWKDFYPLKEINNIEPTPEWFDKKVETKQVTKEEQKEMEDLLKEFK